MLLHISLNTADPLLWLNREHARQLTHENHEKVGFFFWGGGGGKMELQIHEDILVSGQKDSFLWTVFIMSAF